jgi:PTH1 family peptidyl-tRNA hydrolase
VVAVSLKNDCVTAIMNYYKIPISNLIVVCDDADGLVGSLRIRKDGSSGGQNGLKDIINKVGTDKFTRVKLGIGRPEDHHISLADYVLSNFTMEQRHKIDLVVKKTCEMLMHYINGKPIDYLISQYNRIW